MRGDARRSCVKNGHTAPWAVELSFLLPLPLPIPLIILQRFEYIILGLTGGDTSGEILAQTVCPEGDFLPLVGFFFAEDGFNGLLGEGTFL